MCDSPCGVVASGMMSGMARPPRIIAIGTQDFNDQLTVENPDHTVFRTGGALNGFPFRAEDVQIQPGLSGLVNEWEFDRIQQWASKQLAVRFGRADYPAVLDLLRSNGLLIEP